MIWFTALLFATATVSMPRQLELTEQDRFVLLTGLRREIGGSFVVSGLKKAETTCDQTRACVAIETLLQHAQANGAATAVRMPIDLLSLVPQKKPPAMAIVSLRTARWIGRQQIGDQTLEVIASVLDRRTGKWANYSAVLESISLNDSSARRWRRLRSWTHLKD